MNQLAKRAVQCLMTLGAIAWVVTGNHGQMGQIAVARGWSLLSGDLGPLQGFPLSDLLWAVVFLVGGWQGVLGFLGLLVMAFFIWVFGHLGSWFFCYDWICCPRAISPIACPVDVASKRGSVRPIAPFINCSSRLDPFLSTELGLGVVMVAATKNQSQGRACRDRPLPNGNGLGFLEVKPATIGLCE